jgi:hypothetical protein
MIMVAPVSCAARPGRVLYRSDVQSESGIPAAGRRQFLKSGGLGVNGDWLGGMNGEWRRVKSEMGSEAGLGRREKRKAKGEK